MQLATQTTPVSKTKLWAGRILTAFTVLFLLFDGGIKAMKLALAVEATVQLGYPESAIVGTGIVLLICTILYAIPQTAFLGAILLTGYLGGAVAIQLRAGTPLFSNVLFPVYVGAMVWGGLYLRDQRLRTFISSHH